MAQEKTFPPEPFLNLLNYIKMKKHSKQYIYSSIILITVFYALYKLFSTNNYPWQWYRIWDFFAVYDEGKWWAGEFVFGLEKTIYIVSSSILLSFLIGMITAIAGFAKGKIANGFVKLYITFVRNTPVLVQIYLTYFILAPILGIDRFITGVIVLSIYEGAFVSEIIRGAIKSVNRGQWEACYSLGINPFYTAKKVILPQALRLLIAPITNVSINLLKHSSIVSVIAVQDLTTVGRDLISETYLTMEIWIAIAFLYWFLSSIFATIGRIIEKQIKWKN